MGLIGCSSVAMTNSHKFPDGTVVNVAAIPMGALNEEVAVQTIPGPKSIPGTTMKTEPGVSVGKATLDVLSSSIQAATFAGAVVSSGGTTFVGSGHNN
jgi:hypothetical protein